MEGLDLELFRLAPQGNIRHISTEAGSGNVKCGTYQFAYRLINEVTGKSTKFSLFTNPVAINSVSGTGDQFGPINVFSNKSIVLEVNCSTEELTQYELIQIAVLENTSGQSSNTTTASLLSSFPIQGQRSEFRYSSNERIDVISLADIAVDDAPILTFKTLATKNNRLIGGNIKYKNLEYDNGFPVVQSGSVITRNVPMVGSSDKSHSESRGYFSDEVYRFFVAFWDAYGNFSLPRALDMSNVANNTAEDHSGGFKDMKFPKRDVSNKFMVDGQVPQHSTEAISRGVRVTIGNIPSWAKGLVVLRSKRRKNILFQSPLIPTTSIQPPDAQGNFPGEGRQAPNPLGLIAPKNMWFALNKGIIRDSSGEFRQTDYRANYDGHEHNKKIHVAFPPEVIFNNSGVPYEEYVNNGNLYIENVDYCRMESVASPALFDRNQYGTNVRNHGRRASSATIAAHGAFMYASDWKSRNQIESEFNSIQRPIQDEINSFTVIPNGVNSIPIIGVNGEDIPSTLFGAYGDLEVQPNGSWNGYTPNNQRCVVITTKRDRPDLSYSAVQGTPSGYTTTNTLSVRQGPNSTTHSRINSTSVDPVTGQNANPSGFPPAQFIEIVNFKAGLSDDRYGSPDSQQDIVSTGAYATFESVPNNITLDVFGGDCFISPFTFKVHDSHYFMVNSGNWGDPGTLWGESFEVNGNQLKRPFPVRALDHNIGCYLESEINGLFIEEFLTRGEEYTSGLTQNVTIEDFSGPISYGNIYRAGGNFYRATRNLALASDPRNSINTNPLRVSNIGYQFEDLGKAIESEFYRYKQPKDNFLVPKSYTEAKQNFNYLYNPEYSFENRSKPFPIVSKEGDFNRLNFASRLVYSDTKILQTNLDGFSRFRVANFYDLEESKGALTALESYSGRLYGVQRFAFCYIPFEANIIETADSNTLAIQSGAVVSIPQYIEDFGSEHIRSVKSTPMGLMFYDQRNSKLVVFRGQLGFLNELGVSKYIEDVSKALRPLKISDKDVQTYYDYNRDEVISKFNNTALVFDASKSIAKSFLRPNGSADWKYGIYDDSSHIMIGNSTSDLIVSKINSNEDNATMLGLPFSASLKFVVNPEYFTTKMFYLTKFIAQKPENVIIRAFSNNSLRSRYQAWTTDDRRAGYLLSNVRDTDTLRRLRGEYAEIETTVQDNEIASAITKIQSTYRII